MMIKVFIIIFCNDSQSDDKNLNQHLLVLNFTSSDLTENFRSNKMTVKGFSITFWKYIEIEKIAYFCNFGTFSCIFNVSSGMSFLSVGLGSNKIYWPQPSYKSSVLWFFSSTLALANKFYYHQVLFTVM